MLATNSSSAGVYSAENDRSQRISAIGTSIGAVVGASNRGRVMQPTLAVDNEDFRSKFGRKDPRVGFMHYAAEAFLKQASRLQVIRVALECKYGGAFLSTQNNFASARALAQGLDEPDEAAFLPNDIAFFHAIDQGDWNNNLRVVFYPDVNDDEGKNFYVEVYEGNTAIASEVHLCRNFEYVDGNGQQLFIEDVINQNSDLIRVVFNDNHPGLVPDETNMLVNAVGEMRFTGGDNGKPITMNDPQAVAKILEAWELLSDWELIDVNILINAGLTLPAIQLKMDEVAQRRQDCIAILDIPRTHQEASDAINYRRNVLNLNSSWSAAYGPDVMIRDTDNGRDLYVPPSGHVAAQFAYTDRVAAAWFAPGGLNRGKLEDVSAVRENYKLGHLNALAENQINPIRFIEGNGINIWGADTLYAVKSALNDIGIRRLLAMLHGSVRINNLVAVFQPNDEFLRAQQRTSLENILQPILLARGLYWYEVVCDERNNTPQTEANGDLIIDVYLDPVRYTKRIHLNAVIPKTGGIAFAESLINNN